MKKNQILQIMFIFRKYFFTKTCVNNSFLSIRNLCSQAKTFFQAVWEKINFLQMTCFRGKKIVVQHNIDRERKKLFELLRNAK